MTLKQKSWIITVMIAMSGLITTLGISRWAGTGGNYRNIQRFFHFWILWGQAFWKFFRNNQIKKEDVYLLVGDDCVVTKSGNKTCGLDCFFSNLLKRTVLSLSILPWHWSTSKNGVHTRSVFDKSFEVPRKKRIAR